MKLETNPVRLVIMEKMTQLVIGPGGVAELMNIKKFAKANNEMVFYWRELRILDNALAVLMDMPERHIR